METVTTKPTWHRWFRRTNVHIAEYILMLIMMGSLLGILVSLWFSFFGLVYESGYGARTLAIGAAAQLSSLLIVAPAAFWLYARTSGQEMVQKELLQRRSHTVFLSIWVIIIVSVLIGMLIAVVTAFMQAMFGLGGGDFGEALVTKVIPSVFGVATIAFGLFVVVKHPNRKLSMVAGVVLAILAAVLLIANIVMVAVRKDFQTDQPKQCNYSRYIGGDCSYSEYRRSNNSMNSLNSLNNSNNSKLDQLFTPSSY